MRTKRLGTRTMVVVLLSAIAALGAACGGTSAASPQLTSTSTTSGPAYDADAPLVGPETSPARDTTYITDVTKADSTLATYAQQQGDVGLQAMLTDGTGFCAFLKRDTSLDQAIVDTAVGAKSLENQTHLPYTVTTFNTLEAVALLVLCPSEQARVPASVRAKIHRLGTALGASGGVGP